MTGKGPGFSNLGSIKSIFHQLENGERVRIFFPSRSEPVWGVYFQVPALLVWGVRGGSTDPTFQCYTQCRTGIFVRCVDNSESALWQASLTSERLKVTAQTDFMVPS